MNTDPNDAYIRNLESSKADPRKLTEDEVGISQELAQEILEKRGHVLCKNCGREMNAPKKAIATGLCLFCSPSSRVVEVQDNNSHKLIKRVERRPSRKARKIARRIKES